MGKEELALVAHLDTVFSPEEEKANEFIFRQEGDKIYGPGTVDIKGGTVMAFIVLDAIQKFYPQVFDHSELAGLPGRFRRDVIR